MGEGKLVFSALVVLIPVFVVLHKFVRWRECSFLRNF